MVQYYQYDKKQKLELLNIYFDCIFISTTCFECKNYNLSIQYL